MERESFIFYASFYEAMKYLPDADYIAVSKAVFEYAIYGNEVELTGIANGFFQLIKPQIDANNRRRDNGIKGGAPRGNANAYKQPKPNFETTETAETKQPKLNFETTETAETKQPKLNFETTETAEKNNLKQPNVNVNVNVNENENVKGVIGGKNFAAADAATLPTEKTDFSDSAVENPASPEKEKSSAKKEKEQPQPTIEERAEEFRNYVYGNYAEQYPQAMIEEFCAYWTEHNPGGKKLRFESEKYFDHSRRLATWAKRDKEYSARRGATATATAPAKQPDSRSVNDIWNQ